jgi:hypothetical protein
MMTRAEAIEASIEKWRQIEAATKREMGSKDCALCQLYLENHRGGTRCTGCPVKQRTGKSLCCGTPYDEWSAIEGKSEMADTPERVAVACAMREFLESLRE